MFTFFPHLSAFLFTCCSLFPCHFFPYSIFLFFTPLFSSFLLSVPSIPRYIFVFFPYFSYVFLLEAILRFLLYIPPFIFPLLSLYYYYFFFFSFFVILHFSFSLLFHSVLFPYRLPHVFSFPSSFPFLSPRFSFSTLYSLLVFFSLLFFFSSFRFNLFFCNAMIFLGIFHLLIFTQVKVNIVTNKIIYI